MKKQGPTKAACRKMLTRGLEVTLPDGKPGIFLCIKGKTMAEVLVGDLSGPKTAVSLLGIFKKTWGAE